MKYLTFLATFFSFILLVHGQTGEFDINETQKTLAKIDTSLYASKYEVTNKQYATFLNFLKENNQANNYLIAQIDTTKWAEMFSNNKSSVQYYHSHPAYANYPVVNISYEGATLFCEWLTEQYNSNQKRKFEKVKFKLPTKEEWTLAARGGNPSATYPWEGTELQNRKGDYLCNFRHNQPYSMGMSVDITAPSKSYWPNGFKLFNMSGNVAEMLFDKGHTKGGSWRETAENMKIDAEDKYADFDSPMPTIGFRYFMEVIEK